MSTNIVCVQNSVVARLRGGSREEILKMLSSYEQEILREVSVTEDKAQDIGECLMEMLTNALWNAELRWIAGAREILENPLPDDDSSVSSESIGP